jgi:hypothetical protein
MSELGFDPRLKAAMSEIAEICERYDCAAAVTLVSSSYSEYMYHFPSWSVLGFETNAEGRQGLRFRSIREDFANKQSQDALTKATINMLQAFQGISAQTFEMCDTVLKELSKHFHITGGLRDHRRGRKEDIEVAQKFRQPRRPYRK